MTKETQRYKFIELAHNIYVNDPTITSVWVSETEFSNHITNYWFIASDWNYKTAEKHFVEFYAPRIVKAQKQHPAKTPAEWKLLLLTITRKFIQKYEVKR